MCDVCEADLEVVHVNPPGLDWVDNVNDVVQMEKEEEEEYALDLTP